MDWSTLVISICTASISFFAAIYTAKATRKTEMEKLRKEYEDKLKFTETETLKKLEIMRAETLEKIKIMEAQKRQKMDQAAYDLVFKILGSNTPEEFLEKAGGWASVVPKIKKFSEEIE